MISLEEALRAAEAFMRRKGLHNHHSLLGGVYVEEDREAKRDFLQAGGPCYLVSFVNERVKTTGAVIDDGGSMITVKVDAQTGGAGIWRRLL